MAGTATDLDSAFFQAMVESVGAGVAVYDDDGRYVYVNDAYAALFDVDPSALVDVAVWEVNPDFEESHFADYWASFDDEETRRAEVTHAFGGRSLPVETVTTRRTIDGTTYHFGTILDITERKRRERELESKNERLDSFATVVSHDLRNPLNVARGYLDLLRANLTKEHDEVDLIDSALGRMDTLVSDLLTLAQGGAELRDVESVSLADVAERVWAHVATEDVAFDVTLDDATVRADDSRLQQLFENLFRNAVEHGGGTVTVGALDDDRGFYVADDGPGIDPAVRERLFEAGVTTTEEGTGFGLAIVHAVADAHGWEVEVTEGESGGARFEFHVDGEDASADA